MRIQMIIAVLLALLMFITGCTAFNDEKTVGSYVKKDDITSFYFTYSTSTNPPYFLRYNLNKNGDNWVFHYESREGDHWPLTENDITVSGDITLTDEQWDKFYNYLEGGTVEKRSDDGSSGHAGPYLYLYWNGDKGKEQVYSFASLSNQQGFEDYCKSLVP